MATTTQAVSLMQMLINLGFTPQGAAAAVGNAWLESGLRTVAPSFDGSNGLWQWRNGPDVSRLSDLQNWSMANGLDWRTPEAQTGFLSYELQTKYPSLYTELTTPGSGDVATLTRDFTDIYERPAASGLMYDTRTNYANASYDAWQNLYGSSGPESGALPGTTPGTSSDTTAPATGGSTSDTSGLGSIAPQGTGAGALFGIGTPGGAGSAFSNFPSSLAKIKGMQPIGQATKLPIFAGGGGLGTSAEGQRVYVSDIQYEGLKGFEKAAQSTEKAGESVKKGAEDVGQKIQTSEQQFAQTVTQQTTRAIKQSKNLGDWFSQLTAGASGLVARIGVGAAAIVLIGLALWLAGREQLA